MNILITGGTGFLGRALTNALMKSGIHNESCSIFWVSRNSTDTKYPDNVEVMSYTELSETTHTFDIVINLAGAGVLDSRWSDKRKQQLLSSRLQPTQAVLNYISQASIKPKLLISSSAIGWYGVQNIGDPALTETSTCVKTDFAHQLCEEWEALALQSIDMGVPVAIIRTGVVLNARGGMIERLRLPFSLGLGGRLGQGQQMMSWISLQDWVRGVCFIMEQHLISTQSKQPMQNIQQQIYNLTAPTPVSNADFTKAVGQWLKRPTVFTQPSSLLSLIFGEAATLLLDGQNVVPHQLLDMGFEFHDLTVTQALTHSLT